MAHHIENNIDTGEYYFVIDPYGVDIDPNSVTMKKFEIKPIEEYLEFDDVTEKKGLLWFEINDFTDEKKYEFSFRDKSGKNYQGDAILTDFNNPDGESANPVPEPATMLLIGSGLISFAVLGRKKFFKM